MGTISLSLVEKLSLSRVKILDTCQTFFHLLFRYSIDQGRCWHDYEFRDKNEPVTVQGLITEPHSKERTFSIWGYSTKAAQKDRIWEIVTVDFTNMFGAKKCKFY